MPANTTKIQSSDGGEFACYLAVPQVHEPVPAIVLASAVHGVDRDITAIADELAARSFIAAAPDLFWRTIPGPLAHDDDRAKERSQPRLECIKRGEVDMADVLSHLRTLPQFNGRAAVIGFCYGGPYAILGPKRLGYSAGVSCHGSQMLDYIDDLETMTEPVCIIWGDRDHRAPENVLDAYRQLSARKRSLELHIFPGVQHGYMMRGSPQAFDQKVRDFSMERTCAILESLRSSKARKADADALAAHAQH
jgi:carboxymethylenebutenolidase